MKKNSKLILVIGSIAIITLACTIDINGIPLVNISSGNPTQTVEPGPPIPPEPTAKPGSDQPALTPVQHLPSGVLVDPGNQNSLYIFSPSSQYLQEIYAPNQYGLSQGDAILAGAFSAQSSAPLLYMTWNNDMRSIMVSQNGSLHPLRESNELYRISGAHGKDALVWVEVNYQDDGLGNALYIGSTASLTGAQSPTYYTVSADYFAVEPFAVRTNGSGNPIGVFYAKAAYGIGGDIVFAPREGLYYYEIATNSVYQMLDDSRNPVGLSPDEGLVAHTDMGNQGLIVTVLDTGQDFPLPVLASSNRGAGSAVFSPDNARVAWMEASGWQMAEVPDFTSRLRVASYDGILMWDIPADQFSTLIGSGALRVEPVAFLDNERVLVQVRTGNWEDPWLVAVNTSDGSLSQFAQGVFLSLVYP